MNVFIIQLKVNTAVTVFCLEVPNFPIIYLFFPFLVRLCTAGVRLSAKIYIYNGVQCAFIYNDGNSFLWNH